MPKKEQKKKKTLSQTAIILAIMVIVIIIMAITFGRYMVRDETLHVQNSGRFYFESDMLGEDTSTEYTYSNLDRDGEYYIIRFSIKNYVDDLRFNEKQTEYDIEVSSDDAEMITKINSEQTTHGEMEANTEVRDVVEIRVKPTETENASLTVKAISSEPYRKTLTANININPQVEQDNYTVSVVQSGSRDYIKLLIQTNDYSGPLSIFYKSDRCKPDMLCKLLESVEKVEVQEGLYRLDVNVEERSNYDVIFVKKNRTDVLEYGTEDDYKDIYVK